MALAPGVSDLYNGPRRAALTVLRGVLRYLRVRAELGELAPSTVIAQRQVLSVFAREVGPDRELARVTGRQVEAWLGSQTCSAGTRRQRFSTVRTFFGWAYDHDLVKRDPCRGIRPPKVPRAIPRGLHEDEVGRLMAACPDARSLLVVALMVQEGLRCCEVARLTAGDVDPGDRLLRVRGKGGHERDVPISDETLEALEAYLVEAPLVAGPLIRNMRQPSRGLRADTISGQVSELMATAGVKRAPFDGRSAHACRHTMANDMLDRGADVKDVQAALGHVSLTSTAIYLRRLRAVGSLRAAMSGRRYGPTPTRKRGAA